MCYIINDLVNRELIRRDFKFASPIFLDDPEGAPADEDTEGPEDEKIAQPLEEVVSLRKHLQDSAIELEEEDSKTGAGAEAPPAAYEWARECEKVREKLMGEHVSDPGHYLTHLRIIKRYVKKIKITMEKSGNRALQNYAYICETALENIAKHEKRINAGANADLMSEMTAAGEKRVTMAKELIDLRNKVKEQIDLFDEVLEKYNAVSVSFLLLFFPPQKMKPYNKKIGTTGCKIR